MWAALGHILPLAVAVALSSVPIMATILILLSPNKGRSSLTFLIGWVLGLTVTVVVFILLAYVIPSSKSRGPEYAIGIIMIVIGLALIAFAIVLWRRGSGSPSSGIPKWLSAVGSLGPWSAFGLALVLNVRPKAILLSAAAGLSVRGDELTGAEAAIVVCVYVVISASTVVVPIIASLVQPDKTERRLVRTREWIAANNRTVSVLILILIGVVIVANGLTRL